MATWTYNSGGAAPYALSPYNGATISSVTLSETGNTLSAPVGELGSKAIEFSPPGTDWSARRTTGLGPRMVRWNWQIAADNEADLNTVEAAIEEYIRDGGEYTLSDGLRSSAYAVIDPRGTKRSGPRRKLADGRYQQRWTIQFKIMWPSISGSSF